MNIDTDASDALEVAFRIGPNSLSGRALALRVIFCRSFRHVLLIAKGILALRLSTLRKWAIYVARLLRSWLDPRTPHFVLAAVLCVGIILRRQRLRSVKEVAALQCKFWKNLMRTALTYDEWAYAASMVEKHQISNRPKDDELYDEDLVKAKLEDLKQRRLQRDVHDIVFALRTDLLRNLGNMCNAELHKGRLQIPVVIQDYITEVRFHLRAVCDADSNEFPLEDKLAFMHETRHAFGRTALMLSGGAALGSFHLGVVRTLIEHRLLPRVLSGASVGSIICSFAGTRTWTELQQFFDDPMPPMQFFESMGSIFATAHRLLTRGAIAEIGLLQRKMRLLIGDLTFQEAYDLSGRVLAIPVTSSRLHEPYRLLNYLTAPHVVIWSAVTASCAFPGLFEAQELMAKDRQGRIVPYHMPTEGLSEEETLAQKRMWRDGSLQSDLPMKELKELFNVNHFIVSQANPHIAPLLRIKEACRTHGGTWGGKLAQLVEMETKHRCQQALALGWRLQGIAKLFAQEWEGDITIVMPATLAQFAKLIQNPTPSELRKAVIQGRRCTWEKLSAIQAHCGIEMMLDECVSTLKQRREQALLAAKAAAARAQVGYGPGNSCLGANGGDASPCRDPQCWHRGASSGTSAGGTGRHGPLVAPPGSFWRRIPSWNRFARERSWGSLEEDMGFGHPSTAVALHSADHGALGTTGVDPGSAEKGSSRWLQGAGIHGTYLNHNVSHGHTGGDSDSDNEGMHHYHYGLEGSSRQSLLRSWTRAGGPIMASPSCSCMLQLHEAAMNAASAPNLVSTSPGRGAAGEGPRRSRSFKGVEQAYTQGEELEQIKGMEPQSDEEFERRDVHREGIKGTVDEGEMGGEVVRNGVPPGTRRQQVFELPGASRFRYAPGTSGRSVRQMPFAAPAVSGQHHGNFSPPVSPSVNVERQRMTPRQQGRADAALSKNPSFSLWTIPAQLLRPLLGPFVSSAGQEQRQNHGAWDTGYGAEQRSHFPSGAHTQDSAREQSNDHGVGERLPGTVSVSAEVEEQGMLYGLAIESSMHGNRTSSQPLVGPPGGPLPISALPPVFGDVYGHTSGATWGLPAVHPGLISSMSDNGFGSPVTSFHAMNVGHEVGVEGVNGGNLMHSVSEVGGQPNLATGALRDRGTVNVSAGLGAQPQAAGPGADPTWGGSRLASLSQPQEDKSKAQGTPFGAGERQGEDCAAAQASRDGQTCEEPQLHAGADISDGVSENTGSSIGCERKPSDDGTVPSNATLSARASASSPRA